MPSEHYNSVQNDATGIGYIDGLYGYAMALTGDPAEAEELVRDTYVFKILRTVWLSQAAKQRTGPQMIRTDLEDASAIEEHSHKTYPGSTEKEQARAAIGKLPTDFREVILLREFEEFSYHEMVGLLDCPVGMVVSRLEKARSKLRILLSSTLTR